MVRNNSKKKESRNKGENNRRLLSGRFNVKTKCTQEVVSTAVESAARVGKKKAISRPIEHPKCMNLTETTVIDTQCAKILIKNVKQLI